MTRRPYKASSIRRIAPFFNEAIQECRLIAMWIQVKTQVSRWQPEDVSPLQNVLTPFGPTQPPNEWLSWAFSPGFKQPSGDGDYPPPSDAEVKSGAVSSLPPTCIHDMYMDSFAFTFIELKFWLIHNNFALLYKQIHKSGSVQVMLSASQLCGRTAGFRTVRTLCRNLIFTYRSI